jgi:hypothetical protein
MPQVVDRGYLDYFRLQLGNLAMCFWWNVGCEHKLSRTPERRDRFAFFSAHLFEFPFSQKLRR